MTTNLAWPVEIAPVGPVAVGSMLWRHRGQVQLTVLVKATFAFTPGGVMSVAAPAPILLTEVHVGGNPMRSVLAPSDLCPFLDRADVLFAGHAHAPRGAPATALPIRLALLRDQRPVLDKTLLVFGDRAPPRPGQPLSEPAPFQRMPIVYERAFGGIGPSGNPLGVGLGASQGDGVPNIVRPERGSTETASFGPIPPFFPERKRLLNGYPRELLCRLTAELPDVLDRSCFQSAPEDQRTAYLRGDEVIALENLHPSFPQLVTRLPGARAKARLCTPDGVEEPIDLEADTLLIEGDHDRASLTFRASHPLLREHVVSGLFILAGLELNALPIAWPDPRDRRRLYRPVTVPVQGAEPTARAAASTPGLADVTYELSPRDAASAAPLQAPFAVAEPGAPRFDKGEPIPGAPWAPRPPMDTLLLIEPDTTTDSRSTLPDDADLLIIDEEETGDLADKLRAETAAPEPKTPPPPTPSPVSPPEEEVDERASTRRMAPLKLPRIQPPAPPRSLSQTSRFAQVSSLSETSSHSSTRTGPEAPISAPLPPPRVPAPPPSAPAISPPRPPHDSAPAVVPPPRAPHDSASAISPPRVPPRRGPRLGVVPPPRVPAPRGSSPAAVSAKVLPFVPAPPPSSPAAVSAPVAVSAPLVPLVPAPPVVVETGIRAEVIARLRARTALDGLDLAGADLHGIDFSDASLAHLNLRDARLDHCSFEDARLAFANLAGADLTSSTLLGADLGGADLSRAVLTEARLDRAALCSANLSAARGDKVSFQGANLDGADLRAAHLHEAVFDGASLKRARAHKADLSRSRFERADLSDAVLRSAGLAGASLKHARLDGASFIEANLQQANLHGATIQSAKMNGANLKGVIYTDNDAVEVDPQRKEQS